MMKRNIVWGGLVVAVLVMPAIAQAQGGGTAYMLEALEEQRRVDRAEARAEAATTRLTEAAEARLRATLTRAQLQAYGAYQRRVIARKTRWYQPRPTSDPLSMFVHKCTTLYADKPGCVAFQGDAIVAPRAEADLAMILSAQQAEADLARVLSDIEARKAADERAIEDSRARSKERQREYLDQRLDEHLRREERERYSR